MQKFCSHAVFNTAEKKGYCSGSVKTDLSCHPGAWDLFTPLKPFCLFYFYCERPT